MLIFGDFRENFDFWSKLKFYETHLWASSAVENRQTNNKMSQSERELHGDDFRYP